MSTTPTPTAAVALTIGAQLVIEPGYPAAVHDAVRRRFTLANPAYADAVRFDRDTRDLSAHLLYYDVRADGGLVVPRGALELVYRDCLALGVKPSWTDETHVAAPVAFEEHVTLSEAQERAVAEVLTTRMGLLESAAGSGKTIMGMVIVARRRQPALWLTHTRALARQAVERAGQVLGLAPEEIGVVGDGECRVGARLTIALVQSLARGIPPALLDVGTVVLDEAHHAPAEQIAAVVNQFPARHLTGLTATPYRRDKLDEVIFWAMGPVRARIAKEDLTDRLITPMVVRRETGLRVEGDNFVTLVNQVVAYTDRNLLIVGDTLRAVGQGRRCLLLSDRIGHTEALAAMLTAQGVAAAALHGKLPKRRRGEIIDALNAGDLSVVCATSNVAGEGLDVPALSWLGLTTPCSFTGRITQYLGRISRTAAGKVDAVCYDYLDAHPMFYASYRNRRFVYERLGCQITAVGGTSAWGQRRRSA